MAIERKGSFIIFDGLDGGGKGVLFKGLKNHFLDKYSIFDLVKYSKEKHMLPEAHELEKYDMIFSEEPTHCGIGKIIREEIVKDNGRHYSALCTAEAYALDRETLYKRLIIPLLEQGKTIIQGRGVSSSIAYQPIQAEPLDLNVLLSLKGNKLALSHAPVCLVIMDANADVVMPRLKDREEQDQAIFENKSFQEQLYERYTSEWFRKRFESLGSKVVYLDMNRSIDEEVNDAVKIVLPYVQNKK